MSAGALIVPPAALAQARYALHEKLYRCRQNLDTAKEVFPADSPNVIFWSHECQRVGSALHELGGAP